MHNSISEVYSVSYYNCSCFQGIVFATIELNEFLDMDL